MEVSDRQQQLLRRLPGVDQLILQASGNLASPAIPKSVLVRAIRETLEALRRAILQDPETLTEERLSSEGLLAQVRARTAALQAYRLKRTINAAGVVVHTNLGRSCLANEAIAHVAAVAGHYSNLEFDLAQGRRGSRYSLVEELLCELSGAEAAMAVNNNAAAVLLCLDTLARGKQVLVSRGELVEIGGSFRIPDVMAKSGAVLKEVGTTNRTHLRDYRNALGSETGLLLKVHTSNYAIVGFTASVSLAELCALGREFGLPVMEDLGSGNFIDLTQYGLPPEPTVQQSVAAGADLVTFSGDKLLGGPQAGLIVGRRALVERVKANPLTRALRIDKMTLAALEATLRLYRDPAKAVLQIPTMRMLSMSYAQTEGRAAMLAEGLKGLGDKRLQVRLLDLPSAAGGGSLPRTELPSRCVGVSLAGHSANRLEQALRAHTPPIIGRIENDLLILDPRTLLEGESELIVQAMAEILEGFQGGK